MADMGKGYAYHAGGVSSRQGLPLFISSLLTFVPLPCLIYHATQRRHGAFYVTADCFFIYNFDTGGRISTHASGGGVGQHQDGPCKVETELRFGYDRLRS